MVKTANYRVGSKALMLMLSLHTLRKFARQLRVCCDACGGKLGPYEQGTHYECDAADVKWAKLSKEPDVPAETQRNRLIVAVLTGIQRGWWPDGPRDSDRGGIGVGAGSPGGDPDLAQPPVSDS